VVELQAVKKQKLFLDTIGFINVYNSFKHWTTNYKSTLDKKIDEDFWYKEGEKENNPIKAEKE